ncbi:MAG: tRNA (N6-threonylcarbamoyladenosine(37)-N6)-methyltransferase TrmO [Desulfobacteraceae bacterium]|nr:tRNA (N6-threonylcarbamoyladenosine(37)-N6)-methyltransferase TrmO [Desulfobacteraceae bacterium]
MEYKFKPIGIIHSCFKENFGIPRQPGIVSEAGAILELYPPYASKEALRGLEGFSHIWVVFIFHALKKKGWKATIRPPRLGGNKRIGVFASRSPFRPNPIGLSAVEIEDIIKKNEKAFIHLKGVDFLDNTPVLDIKPYIAYGDSIPEAECSFAKRPPTPSMEIVFSHEASLSCESLKEKHPALKKLIAQILEYDPRPSYYPKKSKRSTFGVKLFDLDIKWEVKENPATVTVIEKVLK